MKVIFLDYDGVVNNLVFIRPNGEPTFNYYDRKSLFKPFKIFGKYFFLRDRKVNDKQAIGWLNLICKKFNAKVVVTSTWRTRKDYDKCLYRAGFKGEVIGRTDWLSITKGRGLEIQKWLDDHKDLKIEDFIILDDDADMCHLMDHLIQTNSYDGLKGSHYAEIRKRWFTTAEAGASNEGLD